MSTIRNRRNTLYGYPNPQAGLQQEPIIQPRAPLAADTAELGTIWVDTTAHTFYVLTNTVGKTNTWSSTTGGATTLASLIVNPGNATITAGNLAVTAGNFTATAGTTTVGTFVAGASTFVGNMDLTGDLAVGGNFAVTGNTTFTGDVDITDTASISLTSTNNAAGAITLLANGGVNETVLISSAQGTTNSSINLLSSVGGITLNAGKAAVTAINLNASNAAGGITATFGTSGMALTGTNGAFNLTTGTGAINIGADAVQHNIILGNSTGSTSIALNTGTGALNLGTNAIAHAVAIGNVTGATSVTINGGTGAAGFIKIGATANDTPITIGNVTGASAVVINSGTSGISLGSTGIGKLVFDSSSAVQIDGTTASYYKVTGAAQDLTLSSVGGSVNVTASEAAADAIVLNASNAASGISITSGTGGLTATTTGAYSITGSVGSTVQTIAGATLTLSSTGGDVVVQSDAAASDAISINASNAGGGVTISTGSAHCNILSSGSLLFDAQVSSHITTTGAGMNLLLSSVGGAVNIASNEAALDAVTITASDAGGGVEIIANGLVAVTPATDTQASPSAASTVNARVICVTFTGFTTVATATQKFTITSNKILATSGILVNVTNLNTSGNGAIMSLVGTQQAAGSIAINTKNNGGGALGVGDNVIITVWIVS